MHEPALKCENNAIFKAKLYSKTIYSFKTVHSICFGLGGNLEFLDLLKKKFYNTDYWLNFP